MEVLATRKSPKTFDVDLIGLEDYEPVSTSSFTKLNNVLTALKDACS